ncbi:MAG: hypothetical protein AB2799_13165 [Candidatus Thiodiazotropha sp.]
MIAPCPRPSTPYRQNGSLCSKALGDKPLFAHPSCRICPNTVDILLYQVSWPCVTPIFSWFKKENYETSLNQQRGERIRTDDPCEIKALGENRQYPCDSITENIVINQYLAKMAHFEEETSNRLFQTLEEWNEFLRKYAPFFKEVA